ncbi:MAG: glycosyltransferase family 4 protein, partial [Pseudomonadota bacterium]|nr:glycosyltransferase family 4 protein [Pseudomonadota bacterium]
MAPGIDLALANSLRKLGATPRSVNLSNASLNPLATARTTRRLLRHFRELKPHTVLSYTIKPVTLGAVAARQADVPNVVALITGLGYAFTGGGGLKRRVARVAASILYRRALRVCDHIIFQNPDDEADFRRLGLLPRAVAPSLVNGSGVDLGVFAPVPLDDAPRFLMIARLLGDKGVREYGAAAARLKQLYPQARFALAGYLDPSPDSITQDELDAMVAGGIDFLGKLEDVRPAIAACNVYVLPSYREGTPRSVLEAMAMGRAIITTDAPGCRQAVADGVNGRLVRPRDATALTTAMEDFIENPAMIASMGAASRERAVEM